MDKTEDATDAMKDEEEEDEITYAGEIGPELVGSAKEVLDAGFVIDEDSPEGIMDDVFGSADTDADDE